MIITLKDLWKTYPMGKLEVHALKGVNLEITEGDFVSVAGPSGSGKTTMMNIIGLVDTPTKGQVYVQGRETSFLNRRELTRLRHEVIGFVFQSFNLLPVLTVFENVELPLVIGKKKQSRAERREWVEHLLEQVGLSERLKHKPAELSGGQQQRVAVARALAGRPRIVIADEPTANLDSETGEKVLGLMKRINQEDKTTFLFSTHDPAIWEMADHVIFLHDGNIESEKKPEKKR
jgi:putative ABC transport system ATP-binding protein